MFLRAFLRALLRAFLRAFLSAWLQVKSLEVLRMSSKPGGLETTISKALDDLDGSGGVDMIELKSEKKR